MAEKMAIVVHSGAPDKLLSLATICTGAVAQDFEVDIFLMLQAVNAFRKDMAPADRPFSENDELRPAVNENAKKLNHTPWYEMLAELREMGEVRINVCSAAPQLLGIEMDDLLDIVDGAVGALHIVSTAQEADVHFFI